MLLSLIQSLGIEILRFEIYKEQGLKRIYEGKYFYPEIAG